MYSNVKIINDIDIVISFLYKPLILNINILKKKIRTCISWQTVGQPFPRFVDMFVNNVKGTM